MDKKYSLNKEQNLFLARRKLTEYIYKIAMLCDIDVKYTDVQLICDDEIINGIKVNDIIKIHNLKIAWEYIFANINSAIGIDFICKINSILCGNGMYYNAGEIRKTVKKINENILSEIPFEEDIIKDLFKILSIKLPTERAIELMLYCIKKNIFYSSNLQTAILIANKIMINNGCGIISIPNDKISCFLDLIMNFYSTNDSTELKYFIYDNCIDGMNL